MVMLRTAWPNPLNCGTICVLDNRCRTTPAMVLHIQSRGERHEAQSDSPGSCCDGCLGGPILRTAVSDPDCAKAGDPSCRFSPFDVILSGEPGWGHSLYVGKHRLGSGHGPACQGRV